MVEKNATALLGALVADAAALGVHWIYDVPRIKAVAASSGSAAFVPVCAENYEGVPAYFAHAKRCDGMQSQYGEVLRLVMREIEDNNGFETASYSSAFTAHFGAGGQFQGYIDRPTRGALENIAAEVSPSGIDDDQLPAISTLPAILARYSGAEQGSKIKDAMEITNVNSVAQQYGAVFASVLNGVVQGESVNSALQLAAEGAHEDVRESLSSAIASSEADSVAYGGETGRACHLPMALPLAFHILARAQSFEDAIERNNLAGGDSCGRAIFIGSVMGAAFGVAGESGIPLDWVLKTYDAQEIWRQSRALAE